MKHTFSIIAIFFFGTGHCLAATPIAQEICPSVKNIAESVFQAVETGVEDAQIEVALAAARDGVNSTPGITSGEAAIARDLVKQAGYIGRNETSFANAGKTAASMCDRKLASMLQTQPSLAPLP